MIHFFLDQCMIIFYSLRTYANERLIFLLNNVIILLATVVEGNPKASFSIATTSRCREGCYSFPWIAPLYP